MLEIAPAGCTAGVAPSAQSRGGKPKDCEPIAPAPS